MRKALSIFLAVALSMSVLVGCGSTDQSTASTVPPSTDAASTSTVATTSDDTWSGDPVALKMMVFGATEAYTNINTKFLAANPDIDKKLDIEVELGGGGDQDVATKLRLLLASGEDLPDIVRLNYTQLPEFAEAGVLETIEDYIAPYKDNIIDAAQNVMQYKDKYYAFPREIKPKVWFYRADIFKECGIDPAKIKTLDEYLAAGKTIREKYPKACMENYNVPSQKYDLTMMLSGTENGRFATEEGVYDFVNNADVRKSFENVKKIYDSGLSSTAAEWSADWAPAFSSGEIVSQLIGGWFKTDFKNFKLEDQKGKWAIAPWPEEIRSGSESGGAIWVLPVDGKNKEVTGAYIAKLCFDNEAAKIIFDETGIIPALKSAKDDAHFNSASDYYATSLGPVNFEAMSYLKVYPYTPASTQEITIALQYLDEYLTGKMTLDEALTAAQKDMLNQIGNPYKK